MPNAKAITLISKQLAKWFIKSVWPWVVKTIWPILQDKIVEIFLKVASTVQGRLIEWFESRDQLKADAAQKKADEADTLSKSATNDAEAEKQRAIAEVWRQVAEQFRQENEFLKTKLDDVISKSASDFRSDLENLDVEHLIEEGKDASLQLQGSQTKLRLPFPTLKE